MLSTFLLTVLAWVFFRADNMDHAWQFIGTIFSKTLMEIPHFEGMQNALITSILIFIFMIIEWFGREREYAIQRLGLNWKPSYRYAVYYMILIVIYWFGGEQQEFIYFQF